MVRLGPVNKRDDISIALEFLYRGKNLRRVYYLVIIPELWIYKYCIKKKRIDNNNNEKSKGTIKDLIYIKKKKTNKQTKKYMKRKKKY